MYNNLKGILHPSYYNQFIFVANLNILIQTNKGKIGTLPNRENLQPSMLFLHFLQDGMHLCSFS